MAKQATDKLILTKTLNPEELIKLLGEGWEIVEEDPRSLLTEVEVSKFLFMTCLREGENRITGEEKLRRLKEMSGFIPFGGNVFRGLWEDYQAKKENSILEFLYKTQEVSFMDFPGTVLRSPDGDRSILYLYRVDDGDWHWYYDWLDSRWHAYYPSVGCAS
ncbi:MAG: hypothetical protein Q7R99_03830 [bacterium]|nr:hypothetical protein [bacterium]